MHGTFDAPAGLVECRKLIARRTQNPSKILQIGGSLPLQLGRGLPILFAPLRTILRLKLFGRLGQVLQQTLLLGGRLGQ